MRPFQLLLVLVLASAGADTLAAAVLEIASGTTTQKKILDPQRDAIHKATGVTVRIRGVGTGNALLALAEGKVAVAAVGDTLAASVAAAREAAQLAGKEIAIPDNLVFHEIGADALVVVVHRSNPVSSLTREQLKGMAAGWITNWEALGGPSLAVRPVVTKPGLIPGMLFRRHIMDGMAFAPAALEVQSPREVIAWVSRMPGGFGATSEVLVRQEPGNTKVLRAPQISRPLGLVTVGQPTGKAKKVIEFLVARHRAARQK